MIKPKKGDIDEIMRLIDENDAWRKSVIPDEKTALVLMFESYQRLKELGWNDAVYAPSDRTPLDMIEIGSTGVHSGYCERRPPSLIANKWFWILDDDAWPSHPILYRAKKESA